ncbi:hypothetical protein RDG78_004535 [Vibrio vulnificus]|uniref:hypothetical protein n=1 Tax=Vibrio vulnificus TaxID=672 RepID=UPI002855935C|nr:hypothetical protein [Vibrio vulnificus]ELE2043843.1 hypothetical protein [Vibrio vulnificus]MDS1833505.1 hypothetical protein [Vibrio vulnificus]
MRNNQLIYALYGAGNTGKTTTLRLLGKKLEEVAISSCAILEKGDFSTIFDIRGVRVAITSAGDNEHEIRTGLEKLNEHGPFDILFCAARTRGQTTHYLMDIFKEQDLRWVDNMYVSNSNELHVQLCNEAVANFLFSSLLIELRT